MRRTSFALAAALLWAASAHAHEMVAFSGYSPGTIVIKTSERKLYYTLGDGRALRYSVGVGRQGMQWSGSTSVSHKARSPAWREGRHSPTIPGGSSRNPMGVAAMTMRGVDYAIHGTNNPASIGGFVSHGCIRMHNSEVLDLYARVRIGTPVVVEQ